MSSYEQKRKWQKYWQKVNKARRANQMKTSEADRSCDEPKPVNIDKYDDENTNSNLQIGDSNHHNEELSQKNDTLDEERENFQPALPDGPKSQVVIEKPIANQGIIGPPINNTQKQIPTFSNGTQLLKLPKKPNRSLIKNLIPKREISVLAGKGDVGKSLFYLQLSLSIVLKKEFFLEYEIFSDFNSVLIISTEDDEERISDRIYKQLPGLGFPEIEKVAQDDLIKDLFVQTVQENLLNFIDNFLNEKKVDLVVLDALGDILKGDERNQQVVRAYYKELKKLIRKHKCTILIIAHENKGSGDKPNRSRIMGSTAIVDAARNVIMLSRGTVKNSRIMTIVKSNNIADELKDKPIKLNIESETLTYSISNLYEITTDLDSETSKASEISKHQQTKNLPLKSVIFKSRNIKPGRKRDEVKFKKACEMKAQGFSQVEISNILGVNKATVCRWLKDNDNNLKLAI